MHALSTQTNDLVLLQKSGSRFVVIISCFSLPPLELLAISGWQTCHRIPASISENLEFKIVDSKVIRRQISGRTRESRMQTNRFGTLSPLVQIAQKVRSREARRNERCREDGGKWKRSTEVIYNTEKHSRQERYGKECREWVDFDVGIR